LHGLISLGFLSRLLVGQLLRLFPCFFFFLLRFGVFA